VSEHPYYGVAQAAIHHERFGALAAQAAADLLESLAGAGLSSGTVVDLGCGSGILARIVGAAGYAVTGVDISAEMVELARSEAPGAALTVGSVHDAVLPDGCVGVTAIGEVLNYATDDRAGIAALTRLAAGVHAALEAGGTFLLDLSGPGRCGPLGVTEKFHRADRWCLGMTATEDSGARRLDREITIFTERDGRWDRTDEHHVLHLYEPDEVAARLADIGFEVIVEDGYRTPGGHPAAMPGWYVVRATKPAVGAG
jgi:SAM-dependent methyltransferase